MEPEDDDRSEHSATSADPHTPVYDHPLGGWGSVRGIATSMLHESPRPAAMKALYRLNKAGGVMCSSCAWAKPKDTGALELCENGVKAVFSELSRGRCDEAFFAAHTVTELRMWGDHDLDHQGRLTHPMKYDRASDTYVPTTWDEAYAGISAALKARDPDEVVFYASGHAGLEASFLYGLLARMYGTNNLPQSSNMCHETTSVGLSQLIGSAVGTCVLEDFDHCDAIFVFGQNPGTNAPRFVKLLAKAAERGARIVVFNPVREPGLLAFSDPQSPGAMTWRKPTSIAELYLQVRADGDVAAMAGILRHLLDDEDAAPNTVLDQAFLEQHTTGFQAMAQAVRAIDWPTIEARSGLTRALLRQAADIYRDAKAVIGVFGMGLTQKVHGFDNLGMLVNLLAVRGNLGRQGAGITPVRGHSNVQGQRTVGVAENPDMVPLERFEDRFQFTAPRTPGRNIVATGEGVVDGSVRAMVMLGGNLLRAMPDLGPLEAHWPDLALTVSVATKLNRTHLYPGRQAWLLPCLGRMERDMQASGNQAISIEDTFSHIHGSVGTAPPASDALQSEVAIVCGIADAVLPPSVSARWSDWRQDYSRIRDCITTIYPDFAQYEDRLFQPGGFYRGNPVRDRIWKTESGKAELTVPREASWRESSDEHVLTLITLRSNDQFNTTIYGFDDRLRGLHGSRRVLLLNRDEIRRRGLTEGQSVAAVCAVDDGVDRRVEDLRIVAFDLPPGCVAGYFPELNPLVPLGLHEDHSGTPAYKGVPVRIET